MANSFPEKLKGGENYEELLQSEQKENLAMGKIQKRNQKEQQIPEELQEQFDAAAISRYLNALLEQENPTPVLKNLVRLGVIPEVFINSFERLIPMAILSRRGLLSQEELEKIFEQGIKNGSILPEAKNGFVFWLKEQGLEPESRESPADEAATKQEQSLREQGEAQPREKKIKVSKTKKEILERLKEPLGYAWNVVRDYLAEAVSIIYAIVAEEKEPEKRSERIREEISGAEGLIKRYAVERALKSPVGESADERLFQKQLDIEEYKLKSEMRKIIGTEALRIVENIEANPFSRELPFTARQAIDSSLLVSGEQLLAPPEKTTLAQISAERKRLFEEIASLVGEDFPRERMEDAVNAYAAYAAKRRAWQELHNVLFEDGKQRQALEAALYVYEAHLHILDQRLADLEWHDSVFDLINAGKLLRQFIENQDALEAALGPERYATHRERVVHLADFVFELSPVDDTRNLAFVAREIAVERTDEAGESLLALYNQPAARKVELVELLKREKELQKRYLKALKQALKYSDFQEAKGVGVISELSYTSIALSALKEERAILESERNIPLSTEYVERLQQGLRLIEKESVYSKQALLALTEAVKLRNEEDARRLLRKSRRLASHAQGFQSAADNVLSKLQQSVADASSETGDEFEFEEGVKHGE